jgi:hypothetical protein
MSFLPTINLNADKHQQDEEDEVLGKRKQLTLVLLQVGLDVVIFGCSSLSAAVSADGILLGF